MSNGESKGKKTAHGTVPIALPTPSARITLSCPHRSFSVSHIPPPSRSRSGLPPLPSPPPLRPYAPPPPLEKLADDGGHRDREGRGGAPPWPLLRGHLAAVARAGDSREGFLLSFFTRRLHGGAERRLQPRLEEVGELP